MPLSRGASVELPPSAVTSRSCTILWSRTGLRSQRHSRQALLLCGTSPLLGSAARSQRGLSMPPRCARSRRAACSLSTLSSGPHRWRSGPRCATSKLSPPAHRPDAAELRQRTTRRRLSSLSRPRRRSHRFRRARRCVSEDRPLRHATRRPPARAPTRRTEHSLDRPSDRTRRPMARLAARPAARPGLASIRCCGTSKVNSILHFFSLLPSFVTHTLIYSFACTSKMPYAACGALRVKRRCSPCSRAERSQARLLSGMQLRAGGLLSSTSLPSHGSSTKEDIA
jgi:hypothetical protein